VNGHKNILFTDEKIFTIEEQYNNQYNKIYAQSLLRCVLRVQEAITLPMSWFGEGCPIRGDTSSFLQARCENWCQSVSRGPATRSCETS